MDDRPAYEARLAAEQSIYRDCVDVHSLPDIFHYWSNRYVKPKLEAFGFSNPNELFLRYLLEQCRRPDPVARRFVSIGSGNCDLEIDLAAQLRSAGCDDFVIDCLDLNPAMLERGRTAAVQNGVADRMSFLAVDLNEWTAADEYDAVIANQTLHHVLHLEHLFGQVRKCLKPHGTFVISDMIGRNGHQRWPEALAIVQEFWRKLPPSYRFHRKLESYQELYKNWDYSIGSFEGIRAQDILPLLLERFHFQLFIGFANVIDPFVDPGIGDNFDATAAWDRDFIDQVGRRDEEEIRSGRLKPTHMLAVVGNNPDVRLICEEPLTPRFCMRDSSVTPAVDTGPAGAYEWDAWPHTPQVELETAGQRLKEYEERMRARIVEVEERSRWALELKQQLQHRTEWALSLERELAERAEQALHFKQEAEDLSRLLEARTAWGQRLDQEVEEAGHSIAELNQMLEARTAWAQRLDRELEERCAQVLAAAGELEQLAWARALDRRFHNLLSRVYRMIQRVTRRSAAQ